MTVVDIVRELEAVDLDISKELHARLEELDLLIFEYRIRVTGYPAEPARLHPVELSHPEEGAEVTVDMSDEDILHAVMQGHQQKLLQLTADECHALYQAVIKNEKEYMRSELFLELAEEKINNAKYEEYDPE